MDALHEMDATASLLVGTWRGVATEIPGYDAGEEVLHFASDGRFFYEFPFSEKKPNVMQMDYSVVGEKVLTALPSGGCWENVVAISGEDLDLRGPHGHRTQFHRMAGPRPEYLAHWFNEE